MKPYVVKIPRVVWATDELQAIDLAAAETGVRPAKAKLHPLSHVPRELFGIAAAADWMQSGVRFADEGDSRWIGDSVCLVRVPAKDAQYTGMVLIEDVHMRGVMEFAAKARSAAMARRRMYGTVGEAIVDARLIRVVEHFHAVTEWRWSDKLAPVFACVDGQAVGVVMPMNGAPTDKDAEALEHAIAKTRTDLASVVAATQKAEEILSAKDKLEALRVAADAANRAFCEARDLAEKASLLDGAEAREAELHARLGSLQARLAAHNAVDVDTKEKA